MNKKLTWLWILLGIGYKLQIVSSLSVTEVVILIVTPFTVFKSFSKMRRDGVLFFFVLSLLVVLGCIIASICNHSSHEAVVRGLAVTCLISCSILVSYWMLQRDPAGFKWFVLFSALSMILSTFIFKQSVEVSMYGASTEEMMGGPIFWIKRLGGVIMAPIIGWYLRMPMVYIVLAPIFMAGFSILTSISGRGAMVRFLIFAGIALIGGKRQWTMSRLSRYFWRLCFAGIILSWAIYFGYKKAAGSGWLGEASRTKYEVQSQGGGGLGRLIMGGRGNSFIGLLACRDKPIIGWGPWALDQNGYAEEFITRFGTQEDLYNLASDRAWRIRTGNASSLRMLECHAYITEFWAWYGIFGLIFILYILFALVRYLKQDVAAVPQWYAWLTCSIPTIFWDVFFSPFSDRFGVSLFVVACLMARAVRKGTYKLPIEMIQEIERVERKY